MEQTLSLVAHEVRNPLGMINLYAKIIDANLAKLLNDKNLANENIESVDVIKKAISVISNSTTDLDEMLTGMLKPNSIQKNKKESVSVNNLFSELESLLTPSFEEKGINLNFIIKEETTIQFNRLKLKQVLINLCKNSLEASVDNSTVTINAINNNTHLTIKVSDGGQGIKTEDTMKIFQPYFTTKTTGSGIGLAESKRIMESLGGNLNLVSTSSQGTTFELKIPA